MARPDLPSSYYDAGGVTIYHGDALAILTALDVDVDVVVADPPYSSGGRTAGERTRSTTSKYVQSSSKRNLPDFTGDTRDQHGHAFWSALWLGAALRLSTANALAFVWTDWRQLAASADALQAGGWTWRGVTTWNKGGGRPMRGRFRLDSEFTVWGSNGEMPPPREVYPSSVVTATPPRKRDHIAQKPLEVYRHLLSIAEPGGLVLDPFTGSGSALVAARELGFRAIGIDVDERYCELASRRLEET